MAVDPVTGFAEGAGRGFGEEMGKGTRTLLGAGLETLLRFFRGSSKSNLNDLTRVHEALGRFSIGKAAGGGGNALADLPQRDQKGPWDYKLASLEELFGDFFRPLGNNTPPAARAALEEWQAFDISGDIHYWKGRGQDFHLAMIGIDEANRHPTIKTLFPFVTLGIVDKPEWPTHQIMHPVAVIVKMFVDGWVAFLDEKTSFEPRVLLAIGNQAYIDGDFVINDVYYTENGERTIFKDKRLNFYRRLMVTETKTKMIICMIGVPHVATAAGKEKAASLYYDHAEKLIGGVHILRDF
jgi:hypothetical protein